MKTFIALTSVLFSLSTFALPSQYTELLDYVQPAPDQGETAACLFMASTGAMELIANKKEDIKSPRPYGKYDLSEAFVIVAPPLETKDKTFWEIPVLKFNRGYGIHISDWPYEAWDGSDPDDSVWHSKDWEKLPRLSVPQVTTIPLFVKGTRWSMNVLTDKDLLRVKRALVTYRSPVLVNINDNGYWHVILIVGYDDNLPGSCFEITPEQCGEKKGSFYVRDSFGLTVDLRDYDWFKVRGNAAFVVKEKEKQ